MPKPLHNLADAYSPIQRAEWARENVRIALGNVRESLDVLHARLDDAERAEIRADGAAALDPATEAFVEAADAQRDEYVNDGAATTAEVEHFDASEAADVLRIEHEMAVEAGMECDPETCMYCGGAA